MNNTSNIAVQTISGTSLRSYLQDGVAKVSKSDICYATRHNKSTAPFDKWLERTAADPSHTSEFRAKVEAERTAASDLTTVPHTSGSKKARLVTCDLAFAFFVDESTNKRISAGAVARSTNLVHVVGQTGLQQLANEAHGLGTTATEVAHEGIRVLDETTPIEPSDNSNILKLLAYKAFKPVGYLEGLSTKQVYKNGLPKEDRRHNMSKVIVTLLNNARSRVAPDQVKYLKAAQKGGPRKYGGRLMRAQEEYMSSIAKAKYSKIVRAYEAAFDLMEPLYPLLPFLMERIEAAVDKQFPRY